jgi:hypothetical protein
MSIRRALSVLVFLPALAVAQQPASLLEQPAMPKTGVPCPSPALYSPIRPDPAGMPTRVGLAVFINDISHLNDAEQTITMDVTILERWLDKRLADPARGEWSADCPVPGAELWKPAIEPENLRARQQFYPVRFLVNGQGVITLGTRVFVTVARPMDFRDFPLDRQHLQFSIWPVVSMSDELVFTPLTRWVARAPRLTLQGWQFGEPVAAAVETTRHARAGKFSRFDLTIEARRDWSYYAWKLGLPLTMIVLMAYAVYWIPGTAAAQQLGIGMTSMLTLIAYMLALGNSLPKISYLTRGDKFFVGSAVLVFLGLVKAVLNMVLSSQEKSHVVAVMDRFGRWGFPAAIVLNTALALWR